MANGNRKMIAQFAALPQGWMTDNQIFEKVLQEHRFTCDYVETDADGKVVWKCDREPSLATATVEHQHKGKTYTNPVLEYAEVALMIALYNEDGTPQRDGRTGAQLFDRYVVERGLFCYRDLMKTVESTKATLKAGLESGEIPPKSWFDPKVQECLKRFGLFENLNYLRGKVAAKTRSQMAAAFFTAMAKGEKSLEDGRNEGFIEPLPEEGKEIPRNKRDLVTHHTLTVQDELVGLVSYENADGFHAARTASQESKKLFERAGLYLYWDTLEAVRKAAADHAAKQAEWKAKMAAKDAERNQARSVGQAAQDARKNRLLAGIAKQFQFPAASAAETPKNGGDRRKAERVKRDGPKPSRPDTTPSASTQIREELDAADERKAARAAKDAQRAAEPEEPRGSKPPTLSASLGALTGVDLTADIEIETKTE